LINARVKGGTGEREMASILNGLLLQVMKELNYSEEDINKSVRTIQRNSNQTAVGGADLTNTFGLAIEIKRVEILDVNSWWKQTCAQAARNQEWPLLLYRQNHKGWKAVTYAYYPVDGQPAICYRSEMMFSDFIVWYRAWIKAKILKGNTIRT